MRDRRRDSFSSFLLFERKEEGVNMDIGPFARTGRYHMMGSYFPEN